MSTCKAGKVMYLIVEVHKLKLPLYLEHDIHGYGRLGFQAFCQIQWRLES